MQRHNGPTRNAHAMSVYRGHQSSSSSHSMVRAGERLKGPAAAPPFAPCSLSIGESSSLLTQSAVKPAQKHLAVPHGGLAQLASSVSTAIHPISPNLQHPEPRVLRERQTRHAMARAAVSSTHVPARAASSRAMLRATSLVSVPAVSACFCVFL